MAQAQNEPSFRSNGALTWILTSALVVTVLFVSFALFFSRSMAADADPEQIETEASIDNAAPVIEDAIVTLTAPVSGDISGLAAQAAILPTASTTANAWVVMIVSDANGWEDVDPDSAAPGDIAYGSYWKEDNFGQCASGPVNGEDDYECYTPISFDECSLVATTTLEVLVSCPFDLNYYTKPGSWTLSASVTDRDGLSDGDSSAVTVSDLLAYNIDLATLDFGSVAIPVSTLTNSNKEVRFANAGNVAIADLQVDHTNMACKVGGPGGTPSGTINFDDLAYSTSSLGALFDFAVTGSETGTDFAFPIPSATTNTDTEYTATTKLLYNHLRNVDNGTVGTCTGTVTFTPNS